MECIYQNSVLPVCLNPSLYSEGKTEKKTATPPPVVDQQMKDGALTYQLEDLHMNELRTTRNCQNDIENEKQSNSRLLSLPLELRMQIYHWVYLMNDVPQRDLAPGYPSPRWQKYTVQQLQEEEVEDGSDRDKNVCWTGCQVCRLCVEDRRRRPMTGWLCPNRRVSYVPSAFMRSCRQIYAEVRDKPFEENEFVFINWFSSGLWSATATVKSALQPWQSQTMRYVRLEIVEDDLIEKSALKEWRELCERWASGLRGFRLKIVPGGKAVTLSHLPTTQKNDLDEHRRGEDECQESIQDETGPFWRERNAARTWVREGGLANLRQLQRMEIELSLRGWQAGNKLAWCEEVETVIRQHGLQAEVVCTEDRSTPAKTATGI